MQHIGTMSDPIEAAILEKLAKLGPGKSIEPAEVAKALRMLLDCAEGMCTIHASGMVHRDLKTHNLLVDQNDRVVVGDLGMTHRLEENTGQVLANRGTADAPGGTVTAAPQGRWASRCDTSAPIARSG